MAELHYAFIKNNRVANVGVFAAQDEELANAINNEHGYDKAVWVGENPPAMWSTYNGTTFTPPTDEYLVSIGIMNPPVEEPTE